MRRLLSIFLILTMLVIPPVRAESTKYVALTFDDGPSGRFTRRLLAGLEERQVQATFFLCGYRLEIYPELAKQIHDAGHEIGLHGYSHTDMATLSRKDLQKEIRDTRALLPAGCEATLLRPPGGSSTPQLEQIAEQEDLAILMWSVDPRDWAVHDAAAVEAAVISQVQDGDIILLHDLSHSSVDAALAIIDRLQKEDFQFVTVSQLAELKGITPEVGKSYTRFPNP